MSFETGALIFAGLLGAYVLMAVFVMGSTVLLAKMSGEDKEFLEIFRGRIDMVVIALRWPKYAKPWAGWLRDSVICGIAGKLVKKDGGMDLSSK